MAFPEAHRPGAVGWHRDPTGHHQYRYWDGFLWSDLVHDSPNNVTGDWTHRIAATEYRNSMRRWIGDVNAALHPARGRPVELAMAVWSAQLPETVEHPAEVSDELWAPIASEYQQWRRGLLGCLESAEVAGMLDSDGKLCGHADFVRYVIERVAPTDNLMASGRLAVVDLQGATRSAVLMTEAGYRRGGDRRAALDDGQVAWIERRPGIPAKFAVSSNSPELEPIAAQEVKWLLHLLDVAI